jgi:hypothetical protein
LRMRARVECRYSSLKEARAISQSIGPDNIKVPKGMRIRTVCLGKKVISEIELEGTIQTLLSTLDDILACTSTAESVLKKV